MKSLILALSLALSAPLALADDTSAYFDPTQDGHGITLYEFDGQRIFWWFANHPVFGQTWLMSSVEEGSDFMLYRPTASEFPTSANIDAGDPVGTATLTETEEGFRFIWDILVEGQTCADKYGLLPPGPLDPACRGKDGHFTPNRQLTEDFDEQGSARFIRLTP